MFPLFKIRDRCSELYKLWIVKLEKHSGAKEEEKLCAVKKPSHLYLKVQDLCFPLGQK